MLIGIGPPNTDQDVCLVTPAGQAGAGVFRVGKLWVRVGLERRPDGFYLNGRRVAELQKRYDGDHLLLVADKLGLSGYADEVGAADFIRGQRWAHPGGRKLLMKRLNRSEVDGETGIHEFERAVQWVRRCRPGPLGSRSSGCSG